MHSAKGSIAPVKGSVRRALQGPQDAAVTLEAAPLLEIPVALIYSGEDEEQPIHDEHPVATVIRQPFIEVAEQQLAATVDQLLLAYGVSDAATWGRIITCLAEEAVGKLSPALAVAHGNLDPRFYIKVKKVAGVGTPADSSIVNGVVCRKNIAHKRMRRRIENAKILMVGGNVEFNRTQSRLTSLESVTKQQEEENLQDQVDKLVALKPDIILVERSVARTAQEELLERGISLALNMKRSVLEFLSRCTGAEVAASVDSASAKCVATCEEFSVEDTYPPPPRAPHNGAAAAGNAAVGHLQDSTAKLPSLVESSGGAAKSDAIHGQLDPAPLGPGTAAGQHGAPKGPSLDRPSGLLLSKGEPRSLTSSLASLPSLNERLSAGLPGKASGRELGTPLNSLKTLDSGKGMMAARTLMFFKGCPNPLGSTVLLKGAPREALVAVKKVMQFAVYAAYRNRLETAFLADQLASAISTASQASSPAKLSSLERAARRSMPASSSATPSQSAPSSPTKAALANGLAAAQPLPSVSVSHPHGGVSIGTVVQPSPAPEHPEQPPDLDHISTNSGSASLMSSLMASSAPSMRPSEQPLFSRAVSSAMQPMGRGTAAGGPQQQPPRPVQMPHPPFRECDEDQQPGSAPAHHSDDTLFDITGVDAEELRKHARRVVQRSACRAAADRGAGPLMSLSPHVTVGNTEWTGAGQPDFLFENGDASVEEVEPADDEDSQVVYNPHGHAASVQADRTSCSTHCPAHAAQGSAPGSGATTARSPLPSTHDDTERGTDAGSSHGDADEMTSVEERRAEAGEVLGLQRLYVTTALSNQPRGEMSRPPEVKRIDYYQRTDQALSQFLSGASVQSLSSDVTTYLHGDGLLTLRVARLPEGQELPGADADQIWFWLRPRQASLELLDAARRVPLSRDAAAMSLGHFLEVSFGARHLSVGPRPLHAGYARYFGQGRAVACFLWERVGPAQVDMPPQHMHYYVPAQQGWIKDEVEELIEEANMVFAAIDRALKRREEQLAARAKQQQQQQQQLQGDAAQPHPPSNVPAAKPPLAAPLGNAGSAAAATGTAPGGRSPEALGSVQEDDSGTPTVTSQLRDALVAEVSGLAENVQEVCSMIRADTAALAHPNGVLTDSPRKQANEDHLLEGLSNEVLVAAIWRINSLRRSLAIMALTWASCLHDPNTFAPHQAQNPLPALTMARANSSSSLTSAQSVPQPPAPSAPSHSRSHSASAALEPEQDINLRVLIAHSAAVAAASSAPGSPSGGNLSGGANTSSSPFAAATSAAPAPSQEALAVPPKADAEATRNADAAPADGRTLKLEAPRTPQASQEPKELLRLVSEQAGNGSSAADCGHLTAQTSATSSFGDSASALASGSPDAGHVLSCLGSSTGAVWERAHSAPPLPRLEDIGSPTSQPMRSESLLSLLGDGTESVLSAPGNVETPLASASAQLEAESLPRLPPRTGSASAAYERGPFSQGASSIVSRYVAMFEARQPVIIMPRWQRQELRGRSTDLVLRFLNRHRRQRPRPATASPEDAAAGRAAAAAAHHSDSEEHSHSGSDDDHEDAHDSEDGNSDGLRTPLRNRSPLHDTRGSRSSTGSPSGTPLHPSRLGDASRASTAEKESESHVLVLPRVHTPHNIDLDNVRSNLSKGAGGALSPVAILSPAGRRGSSELFRGAAAEAEMRSLLGGREEPSPAGSRGSMLERSGSRADRILERLERTRDWAALVTKAEEAGGSTGQQQPPAAAAVAAAGQETPPGKQVLVREPSEMQLHFNRDTWKTLTDAEVLKAEPQEEPAKPPASSAHAPSAVSQPSDGGTTPERTAQSRPASPAPAPGNSVASLMLTEEALSKLSLPPAVLRKAQQLPGVILLPNGQEMRLKGRALLQPGVDDRVVVVRDDEPTSLVAFALSSREYVEFLTGVRAHILSGSPQPRGQSVMGLASNANRSSSDIAAAAADDPPAAPAAAVASAPGGGKAEGMAAAAAAPGAAAEADVAVPAAPPPGREATAGSVVKAGKGAASLSGNNGSLGDGDAEWAVLEWNGRAHFDHTMVDDPPYMPGSQARLSISVWFPAQFAELRRICLSHCGGEAAFCASLSRCHRWEPRGGKSNSFFAKTRDDRFIVKQLSLAERKSFQEIAPKYFAYLARAMRGKQPTCLAKIMGVFTVRLEKEKAMDLLVMENVFYERSLSPVYDLKGSERARWCKDDPNDPTTVLLDENLKRSILSAPLLVESGAHAALMKALWADTAFLAGQGVMDYSLIVGVDSPNGALVVGIIDFLRQYTWDKALERWVKSVGMGQDPRKAPTIQSPKDYCRRFRGAMASYFTCVPSEGDVPAPLDVSAGLAD